MVRLSAAIMVLVGLNAAAARATTYSTAVSIGISPSGSAFAGKVTSPNAACRDSRSVVLQRKSPGQTIFAKVGIATTSAAGGWSVRTAPVVGAQYRAIVGAKKLSATNACAPATSQTVVARKTTASIAAGTSNFHGSVGSSSSACVSGRAVSLQRRSVYGSAFQTIGGAISNSAGSWAVSTAPISGDSYRASVAAKQVGTNACMTALSGVQVQSVVYVSATGSDSDPGTAAHPKRTLNAAIAAASAASPHEAVYAATGTYDDGVVDLASGVAVYGGFDNTWRPAASGHTTVAGRPEAVLADTVTGADLERVTLEGALGSGDLSAFGVVATNSTITLRNVSATAAAGASGTDGAAPPAAPLAAPNGTPGDPGVENSAFPCSSGSQPLGGLGAAAPGARHGGQGGSAGLGGQAGLTGVSGGGGAAGGPGTPAVQGDWNTPMTYWGTDGASGSTGSNGSAGTAAYSSSGYAPTDGADGGSGGGGQGGGGGGGGGGGINGCHSYGGGGGGAGGVGGGGGNGGSSGGGSFGIYLWNSTATIEGSTITAGAGGDGGSGAAGQTGGTGGTGGHGTQTGTGNLYGGSNEQDDGSNGGRGGAGGNGGDGGAGGGGAGGPSVGVLLGGGSTASGLGTATITVGSGGSGGSSSGNAGPAGTAAQTFTP